MKKPNEFDYFRNTDKPEKNTTSYKIGRILGILLLILTVLLITTGTIALLKLLITYILA
ncbi:MAG: hypothetical protein [Bacteriophage sp.]|nr:MAG: hypothetical protein [Bacteriophage sp.]